MGVGFSGSSVALAADWLWQIKMTNCKLVLCRLFENENRPFYVGTAWEQISKAVSTFCQL